MSKDEKRMSKSEYRKYRKAFDAQMKCISVSSVEIFRKHIDDMKAEEIQTECGKKVVRKYGLVIAHDAWIELHNRMLDVKTFKIAKNGNDIPFVYDYLEIFWKAFGFKEKEA